MELKDINPTNFFKKITFESDIEPNGKLKIPDGKFILSAILLRLTISLEKIGRLANK